MSRDKRLNRTQEVVSSILISSTTKINKLAGAQAPALLSALTHEDWRILTDDAIRVNEAVRATLMHYMKQIVDLRDGRSMRCGRQPVCSAGAADAACEASFRSRDTPKVSSSRLR